MDSFLKIHEGKILGVLEGPDRIIIKGHLSKFFPNGAFGRYLYQRGCLLKDAAPFFERETARIVSAVEDMAAKAGRPCRYLESAHTHKRGLSKEDIAASIAREDGITSGLVCVLSVLEPCRSFVIRGNHQTHRLEAVSKSRRCKHLYVYLIDPEFGWMHIRIQTWAPYAIQIYLNGREWLSRKLTSAGIRFDRSDNKILWTENPVRAQSIFNKLARRRWPAFLARCAKMVNPLLPDIAKTGFGDYWWVIDQCEFASDILFRTKEDLDAIRDDILRFSLVETEINDVFRFLGRKPHGAFQGEVLIDRKNRPEGARIKFQLRRNSLKFYDCLNVLRIETTINNPSDFKILRDVRVKGRKERRWCPMGKSVSNFWRFRQVALAANRRLLDFLATAPLTGEAVADLDSLCRPRVVEGRVTPRLNPVDSNTVNLFSAVLSGDFAINGFRNKDIQVKIFPRSAEPPEETRRRTFRVCRLIAKLRGHGLIAKVPKSRLYRPTKKGLRVMSAAVRFHRLDFPALYAS